MPATRNLGQVYTEHVTMNSKLDRILEKLENKGKGMGETTLSMLDAVNQLELSVANINTRISKLETQPLTSSGSTYTRWGRTTCQENGTEVLYHGFAGGSSFSQSGAAVSMLCLPKLPEWANYDDTALGFGGYMYRAHFHISDVHKTIFGKSVSWKSVQCAVCIVTSRSMTIMIPAKTSCNPGWTLEYRGYLMAGSADHKAASDYYCIDADPEVKESGPPGYQLYFVESMCGSSCPSYVNNRELTCVVCTK